MKRILVAALFVIGYLACAVRVADAAACGKYQNPFSSAQGDYSISIYVDESSDKYYANYWGKLACGMFDDLRKFGDGYDTQMWKELDSVKNQITDKKVMVRQIIDVNNKKTFSPVLVDCKGLGTEKNIVYCRDGGNAAQHRKKDQILADMLVYAALGSHQLVTPLEYGSPSVVRDVLINSGKAKLDADADGVYDDVDNCKDTSNFDQLDTDKNGVGDACEPAAQQQGGGQQQVVDADGDGVDDSKDDCAGTAAGAEVDNLGCPKVIAPAPQAGAGETEAETEGTGGSSCALVPTAGPNAGMLMLLGAIVPIIIGRKGGDRSR